MDVRARESARQRTKRKSDIARYLRAPAADATAKARLTADHSACQRGLRRTGQLRGLSEICAERMRPGLRREGNQAAARVKNDFTRPEQKQSFFF